MTTLDQITCGDCGEVFHKPTMPPFKIGELGNFDFNKTCPSCGHRNVETVIFIDDPHADEGRYEKGRPRGFLESVMADSRQHVAETFAKALKTAIRRGDFSK